MRHSLMPGVNNVWRYPAHTDILQHLTPQQSTAAQLRTTSSSRSVPSSRRLFYTKASILTVSKFCNL